MLELSDLKVQSLCGVVQLRGPRSGNRILQATLEHMNYSDHFRGRKMNTEGEIKCREVDEMRQTRQTFISSTPDPPSPQSE